MTTASSIAENIFDVVVVGSGAGGLSTAVAAAHGGASVLVVEKADVCGGATAWSGGWMWTPRTLFAHADGIDEDRALPRTYLEHRLGDNFDADKVDALLDGAPEMVEFFETRTALQFVPGAAIADIHGDTPGAGTGHRSVGPKPVSLRTLGPDVAALLRRQLYETSFLGMGIMAGPDLQAFLHSTRSARAFAHCARRVSTHMVDLVTRRRGQQLVNGTALVGRLLRSALDAGVEFRVSTAATALVTDNDGVTGVRLAGPDGQYTVTARRGVVLATGGFTHDLDRRRELFPRTPTGREHWTLTPPTTTGDGISLGESVGGRLDRTLASPVAYCPVSLVRYRNGKQGVFPHIMDRAKPGAIGVLADGRRFVNEALGYHDYTVAMIEQVPEGEEVCSWLIADARYMKYYPLGMAKPFPIPTWPYLQSGYLTRAATLRELAEKIGVDPDGLDKTVAAFNENARVGQDPDFGRGSTPFNIRSGDPDNPWPNPSLAPLEKGPFYAVKVVPGSFGTFAGLVTDARSRVLGPGDVPIDGLYAVGVDQASVMGGHYPSGGINLGPAMTFGYLTGRRLASPVGASR
ncbi:FAD-binding dehydrogenase [Rhodococcus pyridinivorans KG-16]|uniref:FAD-binding dehydrogenase n=1 Tax=Rhodococcus pyridinivorans KG-16 TaxID=1441730 RepID=A0A0V9UEE1_9NOCA|nr:FAD-dependent oxidoreductase [Rhodococcus pyridinivorans]KSZ56410.1 FAD-binding dehydrogenase [Rhodococcus pyridinivorans KG-16]